jgi:peptidyl-prolyl cis-trans isomerase C
LTPPAPRPSGRRRPVVAGLILALLICLLCGCSSDRGVLARVKGQPITVAQFLEVARGNPQRLEGPPDSAKARLLDDLVDRELLVQGAIAQGLDKTPEFAAFRQRLEAQLLRETLYQRLVGGPFPVSDAEVRELYDRRSTETHARLIFAFDEGLARQAAKDLERGEAFEVVADRYNQPGMVPPGGDVGFVQPGSLLPPLDDVVRTSAPGKPIGPLAVGTEGWFIVRVESRRPMTQPPFEEARGQLGEMLRQRKQRLAISRAIEQLRVEHKVVVVPGAAQQLSGKLRSAPGNTGIPETPPAPGLEDRSFVLARYQGGTYTLGDAYDEMTAGTAGQVDLGMTPSVERWIRSQTIERVALIEAKQRRLADEPVLKSRLRERLNNSLLDAYYQSQVIGRIRIEPEDYRAAYERYRTNFVRLQSARVVSVSIVDSAAAATLAVQAGRAPGLREAAATAGLGGAVSEETLTFPAASPLWTQLENQIAMMPPGTVAGPFPVEGRWLVFQVREKQQDAPPFESLPPERVGQLQGMATEIKREARLLVLTDSLRQAFAPVIIHSDRLRQVAWPPAPAEAAGR